MADNTAHPDRLDCNALRGDAETGGYGRLSRYGLNDNDAAAAWHPSPLRLIDTDGSVSEIARADFADTAEMAQAMRLEAERAAGERKAAEKDEAKARAEAEAIAKKEAAERAEAERKAAQEAAAKEKARKEAEARAKAEEKARQEAEALAKAEAEKEARRIAEEKAKREAEETARKEAEAKAKKAAEEEAERKAAEEARKKAEAEKKAKEKAEAEAKKRAEEKAKREAEEKARKAAEARKKAEEKAKREAEEKARKEAEAKQKAEEKAEREAAEKARKAAEVKAKAEAAEKVRKEAEEKAKREAEDKARREAEEKARKKAEAKAAAQRKAKEEAEAKARKEAEEAERKAKEEAERLASLDLGKTFRRLIRETGPISLAQYMGESNARYYATRDPLGEEGDFITAPEISQMFGELVGLWIADLWVKMGASDNIHYVELGPGRGTLSKDVLKTAGKYGFDPQVHFVEGSMELRKLQRQAVPTVRFHNDLSTLPDDRPLLIVANEFFDALPIHQLVRSANGWHERMVGLDGDDFVFVAGDKPMDSIVPSSWKSASQGSMIETSPAAATIMAEIAQRLANQGGAALIIDYGSSELRAGSTLQALRQHERVEPLEAPGEADITAHVDFEMLQEVAEKNGAEVMGLQMQGEWLRQLHIDTRLEALKRQAPKMADTLQRQHDRLVEDDQMGLLFKVLGVCGRRWPRGEGFD